MRDLAQPGGQGFQEEVNLGREVKDTQTSAHGNGGPKGGPERSTLGRGAQDKAPGCGGEAQPRPWRLTEQLSTEGTEPGPGPCGPAPLRAVGTPEDSVKITLLRCGDGIEEAREDRGRILQRFR